jgi:hypothetical protein
MIHLDRNLSPKQNLLDKILPDPWPSLGGADDEEFDPNQFLNDVDDDPSDMDNVNDLSMSFTDPASDAAGQVQAQAQPANTTNASASAATNSTSLLSDDATQPTLSELNDMDHHHHQQHQQRSSSLSPVPEPEQQTPGDGAASKPAAEGEGLQSASVDKAGGMDDNDEEEEEEEEEDGAEKTVPSRMSTPLSPLSPPPPDDDEAENASGEDSTSNNNNHKVSESMENGKDAGSGEGEDGSKANGEIRVPTNPSFGLCYSTNDNV